MDETFPPLPAPEPLESAIEGGVFGYEEFQPLRPDSEQVRELTDEHARELHWVLADIQWLEACRRAGVDPKTGKLPRGRSGQDRIDRLPAEIAHFKDHYRTLLDLYVEGFGEEAGAALDRSVRTRLGPVILSKIEEPEEMRQRGLWENVDG